MGLIIHGLIMDELWLQTQIAVLGALVTFAILQHENPNWSINIISSWISHSSVPISASEILLVLVIDLVREDAPHPTLSFRSKQLHMHLISLASSGGIDKLLAFLKPVCLKWINRWRTYYIRNIIFETTTFISLLRFREYCVI